MSQKVSAAGISLSLSASPWLFPPSMLLRSLLQQELALCRPVNNESHFHSKTTFKKVVLVTPNIGREFLPSNVAYAVDRMLVTVEHWPGR